MAELCGAFSLENLIASGDAAGLLCYPGRRPDWAA